MEDILRQVIREEMKKDKKTYYFMAGLPRSGSTLLSSILNQNPRFHSGPSSPVVPTMLALENSLANDELFNAYPKPQQAKEMIAGVLEHFYSDVTKPVIIDKNRSWVNRPHYIRGYFDIEPKIICPVRDISEVLTSFITMCRRNAPGSGPRLNFIDETLVKTGQALTDENRCRLVAGQGILGQSFDGIRGIMEAGQDKIIHFVEYKDLMEKPQETMRKIYEFLGEEYYEHDFSNIENIHRENDSVVYGFNDMHEVRKELKNVAPRPEEVLPAEILQLCQGAEFWRVTEEQAADVAEHTVVDAVVTPDQQSGTQE